MFLGLTLLLEFARDFAQSLDTAHFLTSLSVSSVLMAVLPFTAASILISRANTINSSGGFYSAIRTDRAVSVPIIFSGVYIFVLIVAAWLLRPFSLGIIEDAGGVAVYTVYQRWYSIVLLGALFFVVGYPFRLMMLKSRQVSSRAVSKALLALPLSWIMIGVSLYLFKVYLVLIGLETAALGSLLSAIPWLATAYYFRKTTILETLFEKPSRKEGAAQRPNLFSRRLNLDWSKITGKKMLFEFEPSDAYSEAVSDFVLEANAADVLLITRNSSPLHQALSKHTEIKTLALTPTVSYPKEGRSPNEVLLPYNDHAIIFDAVSKVILARSNLGTAIVFDITSDLVISLGAEKTYGFLVNTVELFSSPKLTALFLFNMSAHDPKIASSIRALFSTHLRLEKKQIVITKANLD